MKKNKFAVSLLLASILTAASIGITACNEEPVPTTYTVEVGTISWGIVQKDDTLVTDIDMYPYKTYRIRYSFSYSVDIDNNDDMKFQMIVKYGNVDVIDAAVNYTNTGDGTKDPVVFTDDTGANAKKGEYNFPVPNKSSETASAILEVNYTAKKFGNTSTALTFSSPSEYILIRGVGRAGITKGFTVNKIQLDIPVLSYTEATKALSWKHVDGATSYTIHIADTDVTAVAAEASLSYSVPEGTAAGTTLSLSIDSYPSYFLAGHTYNVDIQSLSSDVNYSTSNRSAAITVAL